MLIIHGRYSWRRRIVAYRNDYCLSCAAPRAAFQHRTFDVVHLFWVPVFPLGFWRRWRCESCGGDPHANPRTRRSFKWLGVGILALMTLSAWVAAPSGQTDDRIFIWSMRLGGAITTIWAARATLHSAPDPRLDDLLGRIHPNVDGSCPLCGAALCDGETGWQCPSCGIRRTTLPGR